LLWRLAAVVLGSLLLLLFGYTALVIRPMGRMLLGYYVQGLEREAHLAGRLVARVAGPSLDPEKVSRVLSEAFEQAPNLGVVVFRGDGTVVAALRAPTWAPVEPEQRRRHLQEFASRGPRRYGAKRLHPPIAVDRVSGVADTWVLAAPHRLGHELVHERVPGLGLRVLLLLGLATAVGAVLVLRMVTTRLRALHDGLERLAQGDLEARVEPGKPDELGAAIEAFNASAAALAEATAELEAQDQARREMLADVSHELRTPLTTVRGHLELLAEDAGELPEGARSSVEILREEVEELQQRIEDLLALAREDADDSPIEREGVDLGDLVEDMVGRFSEPATSRGVELALEGPTDPVSLEADPDRLRQILRNLLQNALDNLTEGRRVLVRVAAEEGGARVEVEDDGSGIPEAEREDVFQRFRRGHGARGAGTGLGLAIARRLAERHGGSLELEESEGGGCRFVLRLPDP
jgi:signal transduction histidine kinase